MIIKRIPAFQERTWNDIASSVDDLGAVLANTFHTHLVSATQRAKLIGFSKAYLAASHSLLLYWFGK